MKKFTSYLSAVRFCRSHNLSIAAINKTGYSQWVVAFDDAYIVTTDPNARYMPNFGAAL